MALGKNTIEGNQLLSYIERIERLKAEQKTSSDAAAAVMAEAKASGFVPKAIRYCIQARAMKPHDRQESEQLRDMYMHAIGLGDAGPLFRLAGVMRHDKLTRAAVIESLKQIVPPQGEIIVKIDDKPVRITRGKTGDAVVEDYQEPAPAPAPSESAVPGQHPAAPPPDVDDAGAETLGREAFDDNKPITGNPFPYGDARRAIWDRGWRSGQGGDGMGPQGGEGE